MSKSLAQKEFGGTVAHLFFQHSARIREKPGSAVELICPKPELRIVVSQQGREHVAYLFAPKVVHICATDITREMLRLVSAEI